VPDKRWPKFVKRRLMIRLLSLVARKFCYQKYMSQTTWSSRGTSFNTRDKRKLRHLSTWVKSFSLPQLRINRSWSCPRLRESPSIASSLLSALRSQEMPLLRHRRSWKNLVSKRSTTVLSYVLAVQPSRNSFSFRTTLAMELPLRLFLRISSEREVILWTKIRREFQFLTMSSSKSS